MIYSERFIKHQSTQNVEVNGSFQGSAVLIFTYLITSSRQEAMIGLQHYFRFFMYYLHVQLELLIILTYWTNVKHP